MFVVSNRTKYEIINTVNQRVVAVVRGLRAVFRMIDRLDYEYGASVHIYKREV